VETKIKDARIVEAEGEREERRRRRRKEEEEEERGK